MKKEQLKQYRSLKKEIQELTKEIDKHKTYAVVKSSDNSFPFCEHDKIVYGYGVELRVDFHEAQSRRRKCITDCKSIEHFVNSIEDSLLRRIFTYRYITGTRPMGWQRVAREIGGGNTAEGVRKRVYRYLLSAK